MSRCSYTSEFEIDQNVETLFPLFSPEGEKRWVPDWDYVDVADARELAEDGVFLTRTHDHAAKDAIWIVKRYRPEKYFVQFYKIEPEEKIGLVTVECVPLGPESTRVKAGYTYTGLSEEGNRFVEGFTAADYEEYMREWRQLLESYFSRRG